MAAAAMRSNGERAPTSTSAAPPRPDADLLALRQRLDRRLAELKTERSGAEREWIELTRYLLPDRGQYIVPTIARRPQASSSRILDPTATKAHQKLASFCMAGITSPSLPWFHLGVANDDVSDDDDVRAWLSECQRRMARVLGSGSFYAAMHQVYEEIAGFGTGVMLALPDFEEIVRFYALTVGEYYLALDARQEVDTVYREYSLTVGQLVEEFGIDNCSDTVRSLHGAGRLSGYVIVCHAIEPNRDRQPGQMGWRGKPYMSAYFERQQGYNLLRIEGYDHKPFVAPRWHALAGEAYGSGPGHRALPDIKSLQAGTRQVVEANEKLLNPPMQGDARWQNMYQGTLPGDHNWLPGLDSSPHAGIRPIYTVPPNVQPMMTEVERYREAIRETFFNDMILAISQMEGIQPRSEMEISERRTEKMLMLGPMLERFFSEALGPVIRIVFSRMQAVGVIPPPPKSLRNRQIEPRFISVLAAAQKSVGTTAIEQLLRLAGSMAGVWQDVVDKIDPDQVVTKYAEYLDAPTSVVVPQQTVLANRAARAKAAQTQSAIDNAQKLAQGAQTLGQTDVGGGQNALAAMLGRPGGA